MNKAQKNKISRAIKKTWASGKYKKVFRTKKVRRPKEIVAEELASFKEPVPPVPIELYLENGERIEIFCSQKDGPAAIQMIEYAMNTYEALSLCPIAKTIKLNGEGVRIGIINGRKIIGYSLL